MSFLSEAARGIVPAEVVRLGPGRAAEILELDSLVWAMRLSGEHRRLAIESLDFSWAIGVEEPGPAGAELAAVASALGFDLPVPGGRVRMAGLTWVGVRPDRRGRGYLRALLARHFADCREREVPVSMLYASQMAIYGRFGYGVGSVGVRLRLPQGARLRALAEAAPKVEVRFETASFDAHDDLIEEVDRQAGHDPAARPGWTGAVTGGARRQMFVDESPVDPALEPWRIFVATRAGRPTGYALVRRDAKWEADLPGATATVRCFQALDAASGQALWRELVQLPLVTAIVTPPLALDDPLLSWLEDWRSARPALIDREHVRLVDLPAALRRRRYAAPVDLRLAVTDSLLQENSAVWRLEG
ncbi:MAG: GNAT family N-acetyltransferase, partial [Bifidobacteriaceae bacterium]|nr:GNAT family N-acetyltransferase [Bifidobacteriaceae bacterium]